MHNSIYLILCFILFLWPQKTLNKEEDISEKNKEESENNLKDVSENNKGVSEKDEDFIGDTKCSVESVEYANSKQLHSILHELIDTTYFRLWKVNLKRDCLFWQKNTQANKQKTNNDNPNKDNPNNPNNNNPNKDSNIPNKDNNSPNHDSNNKDNAKPTHSGENNHDNEDGDQCTGIPFSSLEGGQSTCSVDFEETPFKANFKWEPPTDAIDKRISRQEGEALTKTEMACTEEPDNSPTFWLNICHDIDTEWSEFINLQLNTEKNTGWNGSRVWEAIYEENCFIRAGSAKNLCYEERVLYRLLSGMHTSINIHISLFYYPPMKGKRTEWLPEPKRFIDHYSNHPERLMNLHFAFVVLLRALSRAAPILETYPISVGNEQEDARTRTLLKRLLDSHVLQSCGTVFSAFDESMLFKDETIDRRDNPTWARGLTMDGRLLSLKQQFKGVFRNISLLLDCVSCQQCKLHGKLQLLGIGTALKILLTPEKQLNATHFSREEVVALINTIASWSESISGVQALALLCEESLQSVKPLTQKLQNFNLKDFLPIPLSKKPPANTDTSLIPLSYDDTNILVDKAVGIIAALAKTNSITDEEESKLIDIVLSRNINALILCKHYCDKPQKFIEYLSRSSGSVTVNVKKEVKPLDTIIIGGGLSGLTTALSLLDKGANIALIEKESFFGGNSAWASSGINAVESGDEASLNLFLQDVLKASGYDSSTDKLVRVLTQRSGDALNWLRERVGIKFDNVGQLGGHSVARTYRPKEGLAGADLIYSIGRLITNENWDSRFTLLKKSKVVKLLKNEQGHIIGVEYIEIKETNEPIEHKFLYANNVVLATGGYTNDKSSENSLIRQYVPELMRFPTTNGKWTTGDGHKLAIAVGAETIDMKEVQVHPTGFIDPENTTHETKTLCAEILRGAGGILLDKSGKRFCNELGTRNYVTSQMLSKDPDNPQFTILLNSLAAHEAEGHISLYTRKGLLKKYDTIEQLSEALQVPVDSLLSTFNDYNNAAKEGKDSFGKIYFNNIPYTSTGPYYIGTVTPVLHYCMGGIKINEFGQIININGEIITGLYAAGEIIGGVHGKTRLGGNALTECVVFGRVIAENIPIIPSSQTPKDNQQTSPSSKQTPKRIITKKELELQKNNNNNCWVAIEDKVYDFIDFISEHPGGTEAITKLRGEDGTNVFLEVHTLDMLSDFTDKIIGIYQRD